MTMRWRILSLALLCVGTIVNAATNTPSAIPWNQIGAKAGVDYKGDGLAVTRTDFGARLHCVFQRLDGDATAEGLWLTSTANNSTSDRFRLCAFAIGRDNSIFSITLGDAGNIAVDGQTVRFTRAELTEEYSVSMDGVRQDFVIDHPPDPCEAFWSAAVPCRSQTESPEKRQRTGALQKPAQDRGDLVLQLSVSGARIEPAPDGVTLILENSGRRIAYNRLRVTDAAGKELPAHIEFPSASNTSDMAADPIFSPDPFSHITRHTSQTTNLLSIVIDDTGAIYPIRIDPTFSDANWVSLGSIPGADGIISAEAVDSSGNLYIGGSFTVVGTVRTTNIAEWNGTNWLALGSGVSPYVGEVRALAVSGNLLYAGGNFTNAGGVPANCIAQWNGTNWSALSSGMSGGTGPFAPFVFALATSGGVLYAGGQFATAGGNPASCVAKWNGTNWSAVDSGVSGGDDYGPLVLALAVSGGTLYAGGDFTTAGSASANNIAALNGGAWTSLNSGMDNYVSALAGSGNVLYAGGNFTNAGGTAVNYIAQWNGTNWSGLGAGVSGSYTALAPSVSALAVSGNNLYVGGNFTNAGGVFANSIAQWNGTNWSALGPGVDNLVNALAAYSGGVYAGGQFGTAGTALADDVAQWNGTTWLPMGSSGVNSGVDAVAVSGATLYIGGVFTSAGGNPANFIAQWNGTNWSPLGSGMSGTGIENGNFVTVGVFALAISGGTLYAGGYFTNAGGVTVTNIAQWDGTNWSALGVGVTGGVNALAVSGATLYAGGLGVFQWDGSNWSSLGNWSNVGGPSPFGVKALLVSGGTLYAGGSFTSVDTSTVDGIAQWNGSAWSPLGAGISGANAVIQALAASRGLLYAGGNFRTAGSVAANNIAVWNGINWAPVGSGVNSNSEVFALAASGPNLYAGGNFTNAGGLAANYIAQWNGTTWARMGSGMNGPVLALTVSDSMLYAGGDFTTAGTNVSAYVAEATLPVSVSILTTDGKFGFTNGYFGFDISGPPGSNVVIQSSTDLQNWTSLQTNQLNTDGLFYFSDSRAPAAIQRFYQAVVP